jgi:hypothetical protein
MQAPVSESQRPELLAVQLISIYTFNSSWQFNNSSLAAFGYTVPDSGCKAYRKEEGYKK